MINATLKDLLLEKWLRQREEGSLVWTTKDGKVIPIKELTDQHLLNIVNMLIYNEQVKQEREEEAAEEWDHIGDYDPLMEMIKD